MTKTVNIHEAKTHLSRLIEEAMAGEDVVIAKAGKPKVRLTVIPVEPKRNRFEMLYGCLKDELAHLADVQWFPMPEDELREILDGHPEDPLRYLLTDLDGQRRSGVAEDGGEPSGGPGGHAAGERGKLGGGVQQDE